MKTIVTISSLLLSFILNSQNNLQFSQAILLNSSAVFPSGSVWKIESVLNGTTNVGVFQSSIANCVMSIFINSKEICINKHQSYSVGTCCSPAAAASESFQHVSQFPIWLPEGSSISPGINCAFISILQFNTTAIN